MKLPKSENDCIINNDLQKYISCRDYYGNNIENGLNADGENSKDHYNHKYYKFFDDTIKRTLTYELKKVEQRSMNILCMKGSLSDFRNVLFSQELCYADKFISAFGSDSLSKTDVFSEFSPFYNQTNKHLISVKKPENKTELCDIYLKCLSTYVYDNHAVVSSAVRTLYLETIRECATGYYTVRTVVEKTETKEPTMRTGGRNLDLTTVTLKDTKQVVYIDPIKGEITNAPFIKDTMVAKTSEKYKLNTSSCQYEIVEKVEKLPYHKSSFVYLNNLSSSLAFTEDTILDLQISGIREKEIRVSWYALKESGRFSDKSHWTQKKSQIEKDTEVKEMLKLNTEGQARISQLKEVSNFGIAFEQVLGRDAKDTKCRIQREFYDVLENGANIIHPKISYRYKVDIYQSSKSDIKEAKEIIERMENFSGSYTEEKQIYDGLNNPLYAPKRVEEEKTSSSEKEPSGILDILLPDMNSNNSDENTIDDLEMFTNEK